MSRSAQFLKASRYFAHPEAVLVTPHDACAYREFESYPLFGRYENRCTLARTVGSNPTPTASFSNIDDVV